MTEIKNQLNKAGYIQEMWLQRRSEKRNKTVSNTATDEKVNGKHEGGNHLQTK